MCPGWWRRTVSRRRHQPSLSTSDTGSRYRLASTDSRSSRTQDRDSIDIKIDYSGHGTNAVIISVRTARNPCGSSSSSSYLSTDREDRGGGGEQHAEEPRTERKIRYSLSSGDKTSVVLEERHEAVAGVKASCSRAAMKHASPSERSRSRSSGVRVLKAFTAQIPDTTSSSTEDSEPSRNLLARRRESSSSVSSSLDTGRQSDTPCKVRRERGAAEISPCSSVYVMGPSVFTAPLLTTNFLFGPTIDEAILETVRAMSLLRRTTNNCTSLTSADELSSWDSSTDVAEAEADTLGSSDCSQDGQTDLRLFRDALGPTIDQILIQSFTCIRKIFAMNDEDEDSDAASCTSRQTQSEGNNDHRVACDDKKSLNVCDTTSGNVLNAEGDSASCKSEVKRNVKEHPLDAERRSSVDVVQWLEQEYAALSREAAECAVDCVSQGILGHRRYILDCLAKLLEKKRALEQTADKDRSQSTESHGPTSPDEADCATPECSPTTDTCTGQAASRDLLLDPQSTSNVTGRPDRARSKSDHDSAEEDAEACEGEGSSMTSPDIEETLGVSKPRLENRANTTEQNADISLEEKSCKVTEEVSNEMLDAPALREGAEETDAHKRLFSQTESPNAEAQATANMSEDKVIENDVGTSPETECGRASQDMGTQTVISDGSAPRTTETETSLSCCKPVQGTDTSHEVQHARTSCYKYYLTNPKAEARHREEIVNICRCPNIAIGPNYSMTKRNSPRTPSRRVVRQRGTIKLCGKQSVQLPCQTNQPTNASQVREIKAEPSSACNSVPDQPTRGTEGPSTNPRRNSQHPPSRSKLAQRTVLTETETKRRVLSKSLEPLRNTPTSKDGKVVALSTSVALRESKTNQPEKTNDIRNTKVSSDAPASTFMSSCKACKSSVPVPVQQAVNAPKLKDTRCNTHTSRPPQQCKERKPQSHTNQSDDGKLRRYKPVLENNLTEQDGSDEKSMSESSSQCHEKSTSKTNRAVASGNVQTTLGADSNKSSFKSNSCMGAPSRRDQPNTKPILKNTSIQTRTAKSTSTVPREQRSIRWSSVPDNSKAAKPHHCAGGNTSHPRRSTSNNLKLKSEDKNSANGAMRIESGQRQTARIVPPTDKPILKRPGTLSRKINPKNLGTRPNGANLESSAACPPKNAAKQPRAKASPTVTKPTAQRENTPDQHKQTLGDKKSSTECAVNTNPSTVRNSPSFDINLANPNFLSGDSTKSLMSYMEKPLNLKETIDVGHCKLPSITMYISTPPRKSNSYISAEEDGSEYSDAEQGAGETLSSTNPTSVDALLEDKSPKQTDCAQLDQAPPKLSYTILGQPETLEPAFHRAAYKSGSESDAGKTDRKAPRAAVGPCKMAKDTTAALTSVKSDKRTKATPVQELMSRRLHKVCATGDTKTSAGDKLPGMAGGAEAADKLRKRALKLDNISHESKTEIGKPKESCTAIDKPYETKEATVNCRKGIKTQPAIAKGTDEVGKSEETTRAMDKSGKTKSKWDKSSKVTAKTDEALQRTCSVTDKPEQIKEKVVKSQDRLDEASDKRIKANESFIRAPERDDADKTGRTACKCEKTKLTKHRSNKPPDHMMTSTDAPSNDSAAKTPDKERPRPQDLKSRSYKAWRRSRMSIGSLPPWRREGPRLRTGLEAEPRRESFLWAPMESVQRPVGPQKPAQVLWALTRINVFRDNSRTYEVMRPTLKEPKNMPHSSEGVFVMCPTAEGRDSYLEALS